MVAPDTSPPALQYRGRFAPSPTGPLHMGSLVAALASYLDAKANNGIWLVRMEDLDPPRSEPGADRNILKALETLGLHWDEQVVYQSTRLAAYDAALEILSSNNSAYSCTCTRQQVAELNGIYPGTCRNMRHPETISCAIRCRTEDLELCVADQIQGTVCLNLANVCGDFVIRRKDGLFAYQLAVVVDDAWQGVTDVVRGIDLLESTHRQIYLQSLLKIPSLRYAHIPVIVDKAGDKLSKQHKAAPLDLKSPLQTLLSGLVCLQQAPPDMLEYATIPEVLEWATDNWQPLKLQGIKTIPAFGD